MGAIDHADIADIANRHVDRSAGGRDDARSVGARHELCFRDCEVCKGPRWDGAAAGFDLVVGINQNNAVALLRQFFGSHRAARASADHGDIIDLRHALLPAGGPA